MVIARFNYIRIEVKS